VIALKKNLGFSSFFFVFFLAFGFLRLSAGPKNSKPSVRHELASRSRSFVFPNSSFDPTRRVFFNFATNGGEKADEGNERQPHRKKPKKKKREQLFPNGKRFETG